MESSGNVQGSTFRLGEKFILRSTFRLGEKFILISIHNEDLAVNLSSDDHFYRI